MLAERGSVNSDEMEQVFNMGVGMTAVIAPSDADHAVALLAQRGLAAWPLGAIVEGSGRAELTGRHP